MPVRTDRCPHCWASLPDSVGPYCLHCRASLLPTGKRARQEAEEAIRAEAEAETHWSVPVATPSPVAAQPSTATWRSVPIDLAADLEESLPWAKREEEAWAPPAEEPASPPASRVGRNPLRTFLPIGAAGLAALAGFFMVGTTVKQTAKDVRVSEPVLYQGPTFTVRLPGQPKVEDISREGLTIQMHMFEDGDSATGVGVFEMPTDVAFDLDAAADGVVAEIGGTKVATPIEFAGRPGRDMYVSNAQDGKATGWWRLILDGQTLYQIVTIQEGDHVDPPADHQAAIDSFVIR